MTNLRVKISQATNKKVPALALVVVAMLGMIAGVLAANIAIISNNYNGENGTFHTNAGTFTVADNGLAVVANGATTNNTGTISFGANGTDTPINNGLTAGHWMDVIKITSNLKDSPATHTVTVTVRQGGGAIGTNASGYPLTSTVKSFSGATVSTGTVTYYLDLGTSPLSSPVTVYVSIA